MGEGIQDNQNNITRFIVLSRRPKINLPFSDNLMSHKTSIVFSLKEGPGQLFKALSVFALHEIDLTKIESRPMRSKPLVGKIETKNMGGRCINYMFYVDFVSTLATCEIQNALRHLSEIALFLRVFGSYPMNFYL